MEDFDDLKTQESSLTERINMLSDKLANNNLDKVSRAAIVKQHGEAMQERKQIRGQIQELENKKG